MLPGLLAWLMGCTPPGGEEPGGTCPQPPGAWELVTCGEPCFILTVPCKLPGPSSWLGCWVCAREHARVLVCVRACVPCLSVPMG